MVTEAFSMVSIWNLFFFMSVFFTIAPLIVFFFARVKLLDGQTKFWKLFSALGYSYASYIPAILLTLVNIGALKWLFIYAALFNQLACLDRQADDLLPTLNEMIRKSQVQSEEVEANKAEGEEENNKELDFKQLVTVFKGSVFVSQLVFALILKMSFVH